MFTHDQIWSGLDRLAKALGYSPSGLAKKAGLDPTSFNKSKRVSPDGKPRWPSTESLSKVLNVTDTTMTDFIEFVNDETEATGSSQAKFNAKKAAWRAAEILLDTKSILFNPANPYTLKSGRQSPVYIDCRRLISFPAERSELMDYGAAMLRENIGDAHIDCVAGGETAGIPYGAFIAERLKKPMVYVRKEPKGYGRMAQIEGVLPEKKMPKTILVEDLQTDGGSKKIFVDALRAADVEVEHAFVVFHYGIFEQSERNMKDMGLTLHALTTWWDVLDVAKTKTYFEKDVLQSVESFLKDPDNWESRTAQKA